MMGALMKVVFSVTLFALLLQPCLNFEVQKADGEKNDSAEVSELPPLRDDVLLRLKELDKLETTITENVDERISKAKDYVKATEAQIRYVKREQNVKKVLRRSLTIARRDVREARTDIRNTICNHVEQFYKLVEKVLPPDAELAELAKTPQLGEKLHAGDARENALLYKSLNYGHRVNRQLRHKKEQDPTTLAAWKKYFDEKSVESMKTYETEMENIKEASKKALHSLRNAFVVWAGKNDDLKDEEERPKNVDEKAAIVGAALSLQDKLDCSFEDPAPQQ